MIRQEVGKKSVDRYLTCALKTQFGDMMSFKIILYHITYIGWWGGGY